MEKIIQTLFEAQQAYDNAAYEFIDSLKTLDKEEFKQKLLDCGYLENNYFNFHKRINSLYGSFTFTSVKNYPTITFNAVGTPFQTEETTISSFTLYMSFKEIDFEAQEFISFEEDAEMFQMRFNSAQVLEKLKEAVRNI